MLCTFTYLIAEDVQNNLTNDKEANSKGNISERPSILERIRDQYNLHDHIHQKTNTIDKIQNHKQPNRLRRSETHLIHKRQDRHRARDEEHSDGATAQQPYRLRGSVFIQLKADETVDEQTGAKRRGEAVLHRDEVRVDARSRGDDA